MLEEKSWGVVNIETVAEADSGHKGVGGIPEGRGPKHHGGDGEQLQTLAKDCRSVPVGANT